MSYPSTSGSPANAGYDANGNTTQRNVNGQIQNYVYDVDNRLIEVRDAGNNLIATYTYDPFGRRIKKTVSPAGGGSGVEVYYLYADEGLIGEYDASGNEIKTYGYKPNSTWSTDPVFMQQGSSYYFYHNDHLGTPKMLTDISGAVVWSATYDAFGKATVDAASTVVNNMRFPGQYFDAETGLHYNGNRYYDASTGRYVTKDPIGFYGGDANLYRYATNDPVNEIDPMGLASRGPCGENTSGYWVGTGYGENSAQWYADMYNKTGDWYYALGGTFASLWTPDTWTDTLTALMLAYGAGNYLAERAAAEVAAERGGLNLYKYGDPTSKTANGWKEGDYFLNLPKQGSPKANWIQNSSRLREEMGKGQPIFDSYRNAATGQQIPTKGFLNAERGLLENHGWKYNPQTGAYHPPGGY